ncbi:leucyl aminopeptidase [Salinibacterium sp. G-O1]|uniref:leucyl aminopeptidase n=1 Tax=Salinibacterium sp. G-O1 TaxID=3046208 RepID=UPI0024B9911F|nr:leucyl aminopeptidase [Salinibacterium sp. G-O1]MDJ0335267.1 leucyl aminopeptidase [Salinibacterium sp. G-O1]
MTVATLVVSAQPLLSIDADVLVLGVLKTGDGPQLQTDDPALRELQQSLAAIGVTGAQDEVQRVPSINPSVRSIALVGLGSAPISPETLRYAAGSAARQLRGIESLLFGLPVADDEAVLAVLEGSAIGAYAYTQYRASSLESTTLPAKHITVAAATSNDDLVERAGAIAQAIHTVRDLVNSPPNDLYPETFADAAVALSVHDDVTVDVLGVPELTAGGFGGILGVGLGSTRGPRLVKVAYSPAGATRHIALVGKGITFDSGGLSLKPPASMIGMKYDMTGAATVLAVTLAIARLGLPVRVTAWLCLAENLPSGSAMRPNDVITARGGKTIEVLNTDAEGRLVLADGLAAASEEHPDAIIDVATLTGAAVVALGSRYVGTMGDEELARSIVAAGSRVGETLWHMPIAAELRPLLASDLADIANIKPGNTAGGMMIAAAFLREFVGTNGEGDDQKSIPWAHLDIAGPANNGGSGWGFTGKGPTGVSVRALIELAEEFSRS